MSMIAIGDFEFRPRPTRDDLSACIRAGWSYYGDKPDSLEHYNRIRGMQDSERSAVRARERIHTEGLASYVLGVGIVFDVSYDSSGNLMFLTDTSNVQRLLVEPEHL